MKKKEFAVNIMMVSMLIVIGITLNLVDNRRSNLEEDDSIEEIASIVEEPNNIDDTINNVEPVNTKVEVKKIVYDNMSLDELAAKIDRSLHSDLTGTGYIFAKYSLEYGVDPYLAVAIALHESGCNGTCSEKVTVCNNVGGQKFSPSCYAGGSYGKYATLEDGIKGFIYNLAVNYIQRGLVTPQAMQGRYVGNTTSPWSSKINRYIDRIRNA